MQPACFSLSGWQTSGTKSSGAVCASRGGWRTPCWGGQLCSPHPASPSSARAGMKLSVSGGQSQKETAIGIWREWREVFLTWECVEAVLLDLSIRSLVLKVGLVLCLEPGAAVKAGKSKWLAWLYCPNLLWSQGRAHLTAAYREFPQADGEVASVPQQIHWEPRQDSEVGTMVTSLK